MKSDLEILSEIYTAIVKSGKIDYRSWSEVAIREFKELKKGI